MTKEDFEDVQNSLKTILAELYGQETLNTSILESALDNLCWKFDVLPIRDRMTIERSVTGWTLNHLVEYNKIFADLIR